MTGLFAKVPRSDSLRDSVRKDRIAMAVRRRQRGSPRLSSACSVTRGVGWCLSGLAPSIHAASVDSSASGFVPSPRVGTLVNRAITASAAIARLFEATRRNGATSVAMVPKAHCGVRVLECRKTGGSSSQARSIAEIDGRPSAVHLDPRKRRPTVAVSEFALLDRCAVFPGGRLTTPVSAAW